MRSQINLHLRLGLHMPSDRDIYYTYSKHNHLPRVSKVWPTRSWEVYINIRPVDYDGLFTRS